MVERPTSTPLERQWNLVLDRTTPMETFMEAYPDIWDSVKQTVSVAVQTGDPEQVNHLIAKADRSARHWHASVAAAPNGRRGSQAMSKAIPHLVKSRMIHLSFEKILTRSLQGGTEQSVERMQQSSFDKILCNLLFYFPYRKLKPVHSLLLRLLWPMVRNKPAAMAAAKELGIYCFFTSAFLDYLVPQLKGKKVIEIAAGSGILTLLLQKRGVDCIATDDLSWGERVRYGRHVENLDAGAALSKYQPSIVLCSWPPPDNKFEQAVFSCRSVEQYFVVGSSHRFATGARKLYDDQTAFNCTVVVDSDRLIAPRELDSEVLCFTRSPLSPPQPLLKAD